MKKIKVGDNNIDIPNSWEDITVKQFEEVFLPAAQGNIPYESIISKMVPGLDKVGNAETLNNILESLEFFKTAIPSKPIGEVIVKINKESYTLVALDKITYLQAIAIEARKKLNPNDMSGFISILLSKGGKFESYDEELANKVKQLSVTNFYGTYVHWFTFMGNMSETFKSIFKKKLEESVQAPK